MCDALAPNICGSTALGLPCRCHFLLTAALENQSEQLASLGRGSSASVPWQRKSRPPAPLLWPRRLLVLWDRDAPGRSAAHRPSLLSARAWTNNRALPVAWPSPPCECHARTTA